MLLSGFQAFGNTNTDMHTCAHKHVPVHAYTQTHHFHPISIFHTLVCVISSGCCSQNDFPQIEKPTQIFTCVPSTGRSIPTELGCIIFPVWMRSPSWKLLKPPCYWNFYGGFLMKAYSIINSISSPSSFPGELVGD